MFLFFYLQIAEYNTFKTKLKQILKIQLELRLFIIVH